MIKSLLLFFISAAISFASVAVKPMYTIEVEGNVVEIVVKDSKLYAATDAGKLEVYDWKKREPVYEVKFEKIHDFMGDEIDPKVFGVDVSRSGNRVVIMVQDEGGERILYIREKNRLKHLIDKKAHITMREVRFVDEDHLLIATMSDDLILYEISSGKIVYKVKLSLSVFSDFQLNEDHTKVASSCESGIVYINDVKSGKLLKKFEGGNKDNVFKVDYKNEHVLACGQDRRAVLYRLPSGSMTIYTTDFLVYAGALNKDATLSAFQINEENDIGIYDNSTKEMKFRLVGHNSTLNTIVFINDKEII
ncbi:MAG: hypothetical protein L3J42_05550, partial [Hydrogenimonas sp.]|nr:hypothetical protein [Hydrogenimonas sp.]